MYVDIVISNVFNLNKKIFFFFFFLLSVSRAASQRLGILRKSWRVFHDRALLGDAFGVLSC